MFFTLAFRQGSKALRLQEAKLGIPQFHDSRASYSQHSNFPGSKIPWTKGSILWELHESLNPGTIKPWKTWSDRPWNPVTLEPWNLKIWNPVILKQILEAWKPASLGSWCKLGTLPRDFGTLDQQGSCQGSSKGSFKGSGKDSSITVSANFKDRRL